MRRWLAASTMAVVVVLSGCKEAVQARAEVAAEAGGQELKAERLASRMAGSRACR